jgi:hypothetical protein
MPNILPLLSILHLHFSTFFYLQKDTNPSLTLFDKNAMDMDMVTCCNWMHFKLGLFDCLLQASHKKLHYLSKIVQSCKTYASLMTYL